jgi:hypothetical protein
MRPYLVIAAAAALVGCQTWGVEPVEQTVTVRDDQPLGDATTLRVGLETESGIEISGGADTLAATLDVTAWVADASDVQPARDLQVDFRRERDGGIRVDPHYADELAEHITLEAVSLWMPDALDLDVDVDGSDVVVDDVPGHVRVQTSGSSITARNVGPVSLSSGSGMVVAEVAHGGSIATAGGSADVTITGNDFEVFTIECPSGGSVTLRIPPDLPLTLDLLATGEGGTVTTEVGGARIMETGTQRLLNLEGGGPLVYVRTTGGAITASDGSWVAER